MLEPDGLRTVPSDACSETILVVLVLYRRSLEQAVAWPVVKEWLTRRSGSDRDLRVSRVLIYDNTEVSCGSPEDVPEGCRVISNPRNGGTRGAYLAAVDEARAWGCAWVLLLDHDSALPANYIEQLRIARGAIPHTRICAWLPKVVAGGGMISPAWLMPSGRVQVQGDGTRAEGALCLTAVASGAVFERDALERSLPPESVWLDGVDHWIFISLHRAGEPVRQFDATIEHELSTHNYKTLSVARSRSILAAISEMRRILPRAASMAAPARMIWFMCKLAMANPRTAAQLLMHKAHR